MQRSIAGILAANPASKVEDIGAWVAGQDLPVSRHAEGLLQLATAKRVPPSGWRCETPGCDMSDNLWLNLTDGAINCGRRYVTTSIF